MEKKEIIINFVTQYEEEGKIIASELHKSLANYAPYEEDKIEISIPEIKEGKTTFSISLTDFALYGCVLGALCNIKNTDATFADNFDKDGKIMISIIGKTKSHVEAVSTPFRIMAHNEQNSSIAVSETCQMDDGETYLCDVVVDYKFYPKFVNEADVKFCDAMERLRDLSKIG